jgi:hypothetical protein
MRAPTSRAEALTDLEHALTLALSGMDSPVDIGLPLAEHERVEAIEQFRSDLIALGCTAAELDAAGIKS